MITRREFSKLGLGVAAFSANAHTIFSANNKNDKSSSDTIPPKEWTGGRRVGVRKNGAYWGGGNEQIDMLSGNLNFSLCGNKLPKVEIMTDSSEKARLRNLWEKETDDKLKDAYIHKGFYRKLEYMGTGRKMQLILPIRPLWHLKTSGNLQNPILGFVCRWNDYANA